MSDDDEPQLSAHALAALKEFYAEQNVSTETSENAMPRENWVRHPHNIIWPTLLQNFVDLFSENNFS